MQTNKHNISSKSARGLESNNTPLNTTINLNKKARYESIKSLFLTHYNNPKTELKYSNIYELLVCVMLSAQCTDKRVNIVTPALFNAFPTPKALANADIDTLKTLIHSVSFFNTKAKNLITMANQVVNNFNGKIPTTQEKLKRLAGVGQKTANVVLIEYFGANVMAVDTHVFRVSHRLGLSKAKSAIDTENDLSAGFIDSLSILHQAFVLFGRYVCKALKPECKSCFAKEFCLSKANFKPA